jgi:hypothetical protein
VVCLGYHELELQGEPGYGRYVLRKEEFETQVALLNEHGFQGLSVSQDRAGDRSSGGVVITFNNGCETDLTVAPLLLLSRGFNAAFYLVGGFVGRQGCLSPAQARELAEMGF